MLRNAPRRIPLIALAALIGIAIPYLGEYYPSLITNSHILILACVVLIATSSFGGRLRWRRQGGRSPKYVWPSGPQSSTSFDPFSPPVLLGAMYLLLFYLGTLDVNIERYYDTGLRLRRLIRDFHDVSFIVLLYILAGYVAFVIGYHLRVGIKISALYSKRDVILKPRKASLAMMAIFIVTFSILVITTQVRGYGRYEGLDETGAPNLILLGELSLVPYAFGVWRFMLSKRSSRMRFSKWDTFFVWAVMFPMQVAMSIIVGSRARLLSVLIIAIASYHYFYKPLRLSSIFLILLVLLGVAFPLVSIARDGNWGLAGFLPANVWESVMARTSAVESFTVTFENLEDAPLPDPLWLVLASGLLPRVIWPDKPLSTWNERFSLWASGSTDTQLLPTLPGELLLHFGYLGALVALAILGIFWRILFELLMKNDRGNSPPSYIYIAALPLIVTSVEQGFIIPYSVVLRFLAFGSVTLIFVGRLVNLRKHRGNSKDHIESAIQ